MKGFSGKGTLTFAYRPEGGEGMSQRLFGNNMCEALNGNMPGM